MLPGIWFARHEMMGGKQEDAEENGSSRGSRHREGAGEEPRHRAAGGKRR
jgi:hypothetical protein